MKRLFGTDGVRGLVGEKLTAALALSLGRSAGRLFSADGGTPTVLIGEDTRKSSPMLAAALAAGFAEAGVEVRLLGVMPTPAVAYLAAREGVYGAVVSASHNPAGYNGIKLLSRRGEKLPDATEEAIEVGLSVPPSAEGGCGRVLRVENAAAPYLAYLKELCPPPHRLRILLDCANGAFSPLGRDVLALLGGEGDLIFASPDGDNINHACGSTDLADLSSAVVAGGYDIGIAFDGDGDRALFVDGGGRCVDGDAVLALCALDRHRRGLAGSHAAVGTVMSNGGVARTLRSAGIAFYEAAVGDRYVLEAMHEKGATLGGEPSGHTVFLDRADWGDGAITALEVISLLLERQKSLSALAADIPYLARRTANLPLSPTGRAALTAAALDAVRTGAEALLGEGGRVLLRPSGTEPCLRVMVEGESERAVGAACAFCEEKLNALLTESDNM